MSKIVSSITSSVDYINTILYAMTSYVCETNSLVSSIQAELFIKEVFKGLVLPKHWVKHFVECNIPSDYVLLNVEYNAREYLINHAVYEKQSVFKTSKHDKAVGNALGFFYTTLTPYLSMYPILDSKHAVLLSDDLIDLDVMNEWFACYIEKLGVSYLKSDNDDVIVILSPNLTFDNYIKKSFNMKTVTRITSNALTELSVSISEMHLDASADELLPIRLIGQPDFVAAPDFTCRICYSERISIIFIPCGHLYMCKRCSEQGTNSEKCCLCRTKGYTNKVILP